MNSAIGTKS